jgi:mutator protein MutT
VIGVGAVIIDKGQVLLVKRGHPPLEGQWSFPGGGVELGESLEAAVVRETREETGLAVRVGPVVEVLSRVERTDDGRVQYHYVIIDYLCSAIGGTLACGSDADDACWVREDELARLETTAAVKAVVRKAIRLHTSTSDFL